MKRKNRFKQVILFVMVGFLCLTVFQAVYGVVAEPGSQDDPVIVKSYLEQIVVPQIKNYIDEKISELANKVGNAGQNNNGQNSGDKFTVVNVNPGKKLIGGEGTELILRRGSATVIATETGGIADVTIGTDLRNGVAVPSEHLLIIPRDDGRGFTADSNNKDDVLVMIKGTYKIKD